MRPAAFLLALYLLGLALAQSRPNFVIILADDLGYGDLGSYGATTIRTRHLDRLAAEGLRFTQHYAAAPICTPSRGAMLTGRLPIRSGLYTKQDFPLDLVFRVFYPSSVGCLPETEVTIPQALKQANYSSALIGKWHLGHNPKKKCLPHHRGFDHFFGLPYSHEEGYPGPSPQNLIWPPLPLMRGDTILQQPADMETLTQRYTQEAVDYIDKMAKTKQPFLLHIGYEEPHVPLFAHPVFLNTSRRGLFGDAVEQMDWAIGQVVEKLRATGLDRNTLVLFASDNGAWINPSSGVPGAKGDPLTGGSNAPFKDGKGSTWEGGVRGPALAWWPGRIQPGSLTMEVASMMDWFPTILELAGVLPPKGVTIDGKSISKILLNTTTAKSPHEFLHFWRENTLYAIRHGPWKAHFVTRSGFETDPPVKHDPPLLFNVEFDPAENVPIEASSQPEIIDIMRKEYTKHVKEVVPGESQYEPQDWTLCPCCHGPFNSTQWEQFVRERKWSLALWELFGCVCL